MKQKEKLVLFSILVVLAVIAVITVPSVLADIPPSKTYPANAVWFDPEVSSAEYCETVDVDVWMNTTVAVTGFRANFTYTQCCANVTEVVYCNTTNWDAACKSRLGPGYVILLGRTTKNPGIPAGLIHWGTLKIHCCNDTAECLTNLAWNHADPLDIYIEGPRPDMLEITPVTWYDGTFTCESEEKPDLVVDKSVEVEEGEFIVSYTVTNIGGGDAGPSTTCKYVDGVLQETQLCPALAPEESHNDAFAPEECPYGETLNVTVCADNSEEVDESDETNNCAVNIVECPCIEVDIRADGIASNIFDVTSYMICPGTVTEDGVTIGNETAMGALVIYCQKNGINVHITMGTWGEYVVQIGNDPTDNNSWSYAVNEEVPPVGGAQKVIFDGDRVHWYNYNLQYYSVLTAIDKTAIYVGETLTATVTWKDITGNHLLNGASVHVGTMGPWGPEPGPSVGTTGVDGTCTFPWSTVGTWGVYAVDPVHGSGIYNYPPVSFTCSTEEKPDLVVNKTVSFSDSTFTVNYTVSNIGTAPANESTTCKYVDGELMEHQACPTLNPGESFNGSFYPEPCPCGSTLNVTVCADNDDMVNESDETNNCEVNIIVCPSIKVDIRADGIASNIFDVTSYMICPGTVTEDGVTIGNETAMGALVIYCQKNGINVHITMGTWGEYVVQIGNDPTDNNSWSYAVNEEVPPVGGAQKVIFDGDRVHWYNYNLNYYSVLTAIDKTAIYVGETLTATVTWKDITGIHLLNGASVHVGTMGPWGPEPGPSVGTTGVDGTCTFPWSTVGTWGVYAVDPVHGSGIYNYPPVSFTCSTEEKPDLVVNKTVSFSDSTFTVNYTVSNIGTAPANESTTCKYVDGELMEHQACPTLNPGESFNGSFYPEPCPCGSTLNVTVCADNDDMVNESDETNNCEVNIIECPYIIVDIRADGIVSNIFNVADYMICPGTVTEDGVTIDNETAMGALVIYCQNNGININITIGTWGEYVVQIGNDPTDNNSWKYAVNEEVPPVGGAQKVIVDGDRVHWYNYNLNYYSVLTALDKTAIYVGDTLTATVTWKNITGNHLLNGASVHVGTMGQWGPEPGPSVGTTGVDGTCTFPWSTVGTWGVYAVDPVHGSGQYNWPYVTFNCSTEEKPDLVVNKTVSFSDSNFTVNYTVTNIGTAPANASTTCKYVDGVLMEHQACPTLNPGESFNGSFDLEPCPCGSTLNVTVCADNDNVVNESDETNNCEVNIVECPYIIVDIRADGIASNIFNVADYMICPGTVTEDGITIDNETAMGAVVAYCQDNGINVNITMAGLGVYLLLIGNDPADYNNWMYAVNGVAPPVGGAQKVIVDGDRVHWYNYKLNYYAVLTTLDKTEINVDDYLTATVTWKNMTGTYKLTGSDVFVADTAYASGDYVGTTNDDGNCTFQWSTLGTWYVYAVDPVHGSGIYNYPPVSFTCSLEKPDLVVNKTVSFSDSNFTVNYTVSNIGTAPANESTTCKYLDGVLMEHQACPTLNPGESYNGSFDPEPCPCGLTLNVTVCADNDNVVNESDETNNCEVNIIECPYIIVDIRADGIVSNIFNVADYMICPGTVTEDGVTIDNETAMGALVIYCQNSGINIHITIGTWGEYVVQIGNDPTDNNSWKYAVNEEVPPVGGAQKVIVDGDRVHWYNYNLNYYSVLSAIDKTAIYVGDTLTATVTWKNITGIHLLNGASVHVGTMGQWGPEPGPSVGNTGVDGTCTFSWSTVGTWGVYAVDPVHGSGQYNWPYVTFNCSTEEKPDLVVEKKWEMWVEEAARRYNVSYVILNNGTAIAPRGHNTTLYVDDVEIEHKQVPVDLAPGDNYTGTFDTVIACTGNFDTINVCVDNDDVVYELNETNNCMENVWPPHCPAEIAVYRADVPNADGILNALRTQRDDNLKAEYVDRYYDNSPELAEVIGRDSALTNEAARLLSKYSPMVSQDAHRIDVDTLITERDVKEIESFIGRFKASVLNTRDGISTDSTEELIKFLDEFEKQVEASEGKTFSDALHDSIYYKNEQMPGHENEGYLYTPL